MLIMDRVAVNGMLATSPSRTWKVLEKRRFSKLLWKGFRFLFRKLLKYLKMVVAYCPIKHCVCYVCSFYYL